MPSSTVTGLDAANALDGSESVHVVQGGADREALLTQIFDYIRNGGADVLGAWEIGAGIASLSLVDGKWIMTEDTSTGLHYIQQLAIPQTGEKNYIWRFKLRSKSAQAARDFIFEIKLTGTSRKMQIGIDVDSFTVHGGGGDGFVLISEVWQGFQFLTDDWVEYRVLITVPAPPNNAIDAFFSLSSGAQGENFGESYAGNGAAGIEFYDMTLRPVV